MTTHKLNMTILLAAVFGLVFALTPTAEATPTPPGGGYPTGGYRLVFVTSGNSTQTSTDIEFYNTFVDNAAKAVGSGLEDIATTWKAIGTTADDDARDNTGTNPGVDGVGVPIYNYAGDKVVDDNADLWDGTLDNAILYDEFGVARTGNPDSVVMTGTDTDGTHEGSRAFGEGGMWIGRADATNSDWIIWLDGGNDDFKLYGLSEVIIPGGGGVIPEPSTFLLGALGLLGLGLAGWRRRI